LKDTIRQVIDNNKPINELSFYFTGHGFQHEDKFFLCPADFNNKRPHVTGLSNTELHTLLRPADAELVVKVIDACYSGVLLVKSGDVFLPPAKNGFKNLIQIASCLDSQTSLTGHPLSQFTERFRAAALEKLVGPIYYSDIINALRDEFLDDDTQTPHFVFQGTAREMFVDDATRLDRLRAKLFATIRDAAALRTLPSVTEEPASIRDILEKAEARFANKEIANALISRLFEKLTTKATESGPELFGDLFDAEFVEHPDFQETTTRAFIIRVLANEKRADNLVVVTQKPEYRANYLGSIAAGLSGLLGHPDHVASQYELNFNCDLQKAQLKITLTPKFVAFKRFVLVVSCAPSLEVCYVFEMLTEHPLRNWGVFDFEGTEIVRRWYKLKWNDPCDALVEKIFDTLQSAVQERVDAAAQALSET
jgi:hypothetical protein